MSTPSPTPSPTHVPPARASRTSTPRAWRRPLLWTALAFGVGIALSLLLLGRREAANAFFRAPATSAGDAVLAPLPAPMAGDAGDADGASNMDRSQPLPPPVARVEPAPRADPEPVASAPTPPPPALSSPARPLPGQTPAPRYPMSALRRGEGGEVLVRAEVGPDGVVTSVSLARPSGNRALDRAALDAVRRWRFEPARRDGAPSVDTVQVPIRFSAE